MLDSIVKKITEGSQFFGLEISEAENGETYYFLHLKKINNELTLLKNIALESIEDIPKHLNNHTPLFLCLNTTDILSKQLQQVPSAKDAALVNEAFPNLETQNFYWEITQKSSHPIVSIARKNYVDALLRKMEHLKIVPFHLSIGISSLISVAPYLNQQTIIVPRYAVAIERDIMVVSSNPVPFTPKDLVINGLTISNRQLQSFAQILGYIKASESNSNLTHLNKSFSNAFKNERLFRAVSLSVLIFFLGILLINFLTYNYYSRIVDQLNSDLLNNGSKKEQLHQLNDIVQRKQKKVELFTASSHSKTSHYFDLIAQQIPESIVLDQLNYQPLLKSIKEGKPVQFNRQVMLISGVSKDIQSFSNWVGILEQNDWIQNVEILDYDYVTREASNFSLKMTLNEN